MSLRILLAALAFAACSPEPAVAQPTRAANAALPAPTPSDVRLHVTQALHGQTIHATIEQRFAVELVGTPTAGYIWVPIAMPAFLSRAGEAGGPTSGAQRQPGFTGGNHWEVLMFVADAEGSGDLWLAQRRPWETDEPPAATFMVHVEAR